MPKKKKTVKQTTRVKRQPKLTEDVVSDVYGRLLATNMGWASRVDCGIRIGFALALRMMKGGAR